MEFELLPGGEPLRGQVRDFLAPWHAPDEGYDRALWDALGATGWLAPASLGDMSVLVQELGRAALLTPVVNGVVQVLAAAAVAGVADARVRAAACFAAPSGALVPGALGAVCSIDGSAAVVDGVKGYVPYAATADLFVVAADGPGAGVSLVTVPADSAGVAVEELRSVAGDRQATVTFSHARGELVRDTSDAGDAWARVSRAACIGRAALCAEAVGASAALIEHTVAHASGRVQSGGPIGRFQAVQHRLADMAIDHLGAFGAVEEAFAALDAGGAASAEVAAAGALCGTALARVAVSAHQVCGGTGYLAASRLHRWTRLIRGADAQLGGAHAQRLAVVAALRAGDGWSTHSVD